MIINCDHNIEHVDGRATILWGQSVPQKLQGSSVHPRVQDLLHVEIAPKDKQKLKGSKPIRSTWSTESTPARLSYFNVDKNREWVCEERDELPNIVLEENGSIQPGLLQLVLEGLREREDIERTGQPVSKLFDQIMKWKWNLFIVIPSYNPDISHSLCLESLLVCDFVFSLCNKSISCSDMRS